MSDHCGSVTANGNAACTPAAPGRASACGCSSPAKSSEPIVLSTPSISKDKDASNGTIPAKNDQEKTMWQKIRSALMFGVACITSPCCTPLIVPLVLALLAGTPLAVWLSAYIGWVYGGLTLLSIISLVLGFRWMGQKAEARRSNEAAYKTVSQPAHEIKHS